MKSVETSEALSLIWFGWKLVGMYPIQNYKPSHTFHMIFAFLATNTYSVIVFVVQLFYVTDLKNLLDNLPMNILIIISSLKFLTILIMRREIIGIDNLLAQLDKRPLSKTQESRLCKLTRFCNRLFMFGFFCYEGVDIMAAVNAAFSKRERLLYEIWLPYDWRATAFRYWTTFLYQLLAQSILAMQTMSSDFCGPIYLMVLKAHLENIMCRIRKLKCNPTSSEKENLKKLIDCIEDHRIITNIFNVLQGTVSYIIFFQFVGTALVLVMIALNYLLYSPNFTEVIALIFFAVSEIVQILPCCYYSNKFMSTTDEVVTSIYSSEWYNQSPEFKRVLIIFMQMTQKKSMLIAGKIIPVTMATFASILKFSYSLLTLITRIHH